MRILRAAIRVPAPWKNGGGTTLEVASFPESATPSRFAWRISVAEVRRAGPVPLFPGVDRKLAIIEGRLSLTVQGREAVELSADSAVASFPGDVPTSSQPLTSHVTDLNLMTRRGQFTSDMTRYRDGTLRALSMSPAEMTAVIALQPLELRVAGNRFELGSRDAVLLSPGDGHPLELHPGAQGNDYFVIKIAVPD